MEEYRNRKKNPCTTYRREGKTKQNVFECLPSSFDSGRNCGSSGRTNQDLYECCPPTPVELRCSVCRTAEKDGCNVWTCVPFVSYSVLCGPTLADLTIHLLNLLPLSFLACLGIAHPRCCSAKPLPPVIKCDPVTRSTPCNPNKIHARVKKPCPCPPEQNVEIERYVECSGDGPGYCNSDEISAWMHAEYEALARELADIKRLTNDDDYGDADNNKDLLQSRNYVLDRLAEMLAKREEIEKKIKQKRICR